MDMINRAAIVLKPALPFLDWLRRVDSTSAQLTLYDLQQEPTIYLVSECESEDEALDFLRQHVERIFEEQLDGWYRTPTAWPKKRDMSTFRTWFEIGFHSMVVDLDSEPIKREEM